MRALSESITTDAAGAAAVTMGLGRAAKIYAIRISDTTATGGTVDVLSMGRKILDGRAANTAAVFPLAEPAVKADGTAIAGSWPPPVVDGKLNVTVTGAGATKLLTVTVFYK